MWPAIAIVVAVIGSSRPVRADGAGVIAASASDRGATATAFADVMVGRARRIVADAAGEARAAAIAGAVPVATIARFRRVRELVDEGWEAYLRVAADVAASRLIAARTRAEPLTALPGGAEVYADAALRLGVVFGYLGRKQESRDVIALALALDPDRPITTFEFAPDVVDAIEAVRAEHRKTSKLHVTSTPPGAAIWVDGRDVGRAPLDVDVPRGQHVVVARAPEYEPTVQGVAVGDVPAVLDLALDADPELARLYGPRPGLGMSATEQQQLVDATLRYADLDEVVIVAETRRRGGPVLMAQRCAGLPARCSAVVEVGFAPGGRTAAARSVWEAARTGELRYPPSVLGEHANTGNPHRCETCRSPWLWGGIAAAVVVGAIVVIASSSSRPPPVVGIDPSGFLPR